MRTEYVFLTVLILAVIFLGLWGANSHRKKDTPEFIGTNFSSCRVSDELECNKNGKNCRNRFHYVYDKNGNKKEYYSPKSNWLLEFELGKAYKEIRIYDKDNKPLMNYLICDDRFKNCRRIDKFEYNASGKLTKKYLKCKKDTSDCLYINTYGYDFLGRLTEEQEDCPRGYGGVYCGKVKLYKYSDNNVTEEYSECEKDLTNCKNIKFHKYENDKLISTDWFGDNFNIYRNKNTFAYDKLGNLTAKYSFRDKNGIDLSVAYLYEYKYDDNGNITEKKTTYNHYKSGNIDFTTSSVNKYSYNNDNKLVEQYDCDKTGNDCVLKEKNTYNHYGYLTETYKPFGSEMKVFKYSYVCD